MKTAFWMQLAVVLAGLVWAVLYLLDPKGLQSRAFYEQGRELASDFLMPRTCVGDPNPYHPAEVCSKDACYPALALAVTKPFAPDRRGGLAFSALSAVVLLLAVGVFARSRFREGGGAAVVLAIAAAMSSSPFVFNLERANLMFLAAAGTLLFLAWYDAREGWKRAVAALALAFAGVLKIVPAVFGALYLRERRWRDMTVCAIAAAVMFFVPFAWFGGWEDGVARWVENAAANASYYASRTDWGPVALARALRLASGTPFDGGWEGMWQSKTVGVVLALAGLALSWRKGEAGSLRMFWLAAVALFCSSSMKFYTGLLLLPAFLGIGDRRAGRIETVLWVVVMSPLQIAAGSVPAGRHLSNVALLALAGLLLAESALRAWRERG